MLVVQAKLNGTETTALGNPTEGPHTLFSNVIQKHCRQQKCVKTEAESKGT